jgi:AmmeMemoRadiSam system protein B
MFFSKKDTGDPDESGTRLPAVAGTFYPGSHQALLAELSTLFEKAETHWNQQKTRAKYSSAFILPHAGYLFSGYAAALGYEQIRRNLQEYQNKTFAIIAPTHRLYCEGVALDPSDYYSTPLGKITVDKKLSQKILEHFSFVQNHFNCHRQEHAVEVHLPFLQYLQTNPSKDFARENKSLKNFSFQILPLAAGNCSPEQLEELFQYLLTQNAVIIVSSDLSHFNPASSALKQDKDTLNKIIQLNDTALSSEAACGIKAIQGMIQFCKSNGKQLELIHYCNSGDVPQGDSQSVVGYASLFMKEV